MNVEGIIQAVAFAAVAFLVNDARQSLREIRDELRCQKEKQNRQERELEVMKEHCRLTHQGER
jgi:hypothetical protein